jgi:PAS domain S-box-containing protein
LIGNRLFDLYPNTENEMIFRSVLESGQRFIAHEQPFEFPDHPEWGTTYWDWSLQPVEDSNGQIDGLVYCLQDMTERKQAQTKIFESEKKYRQLVESSRSVILRRTVDGRITFLNQFGQEFFGYSQDEILGMNMLGSIVPNSESCGQFLENQVLDLAQDPDSSSTYEQEGMLKNGRRVWLQWTSWALRNDRGEIIEILSIGNDVTERKRLEDRNNAINSLLALFASKNSRKDYLDSVVELIRDWSGCNCVGVRVRNAEDFIPYEACVGFPMEFQALENRLRLTKNSCTCVRVVAQAFEPQDSSMVNPQGSFCCNCLPEFLQSLSENEKKNCRSACRNFGFSSITVVPVRFRDDVLGAIHLADPRSDMVAPQMVQFLEMISPIIGEAIHRFNVEEERREYEARLKSLADRLAKTEEDGRRKISQQLHDTVIQTLSMSNIRLGTLRKILVRFPKKDHVVQLDEARSLLQDSIQQCRDLISDLTPPLLYEIGLGAAIEEMAARTQQKYGVLIDVNANLEGYHVDKSLRGLLYQSANEFVANALKHGSPSRIFISVQVARETITLLVRDDGCGFQSSAWKMERSEGFGLFNIRERIEGLGGRCEISSVPGKGTIATISVPALGSRTGAEIAEDEHLSRS